MKKYIATLYKYYKKANCDTRIDAFNYTDVLTEQELRSEFVNEFDNFDTRVLEKYGVSRKNLEFVEDIDIFSIINIFQENECYNDKAQHYYIETIHKAVDDYNDLNGVN